MSTCWIPPVSFSVVRRELSCFSLVGVTSSLVDPPRYGRWYFVSGNMNTTIRKDAAKRAVLSHQKFLQPTFCAIAPAMIGEIMSDPM